MKVYLDTCVLSRLVDNGMSDDQLEALERIADDKNIDLVSSKKTLEEFETTSALRKKRNLKVLFKLVQKVFAPPAVSHYSGLIGDTPIGVALMGGGSGSWEHPTYSRLKSVFDNDDAEHIYIAKEGGCDVFLTLDFRTIIRRYEQNHGQIDAVISPMRISDPLSLAP